ncbi:MAG: bifunctional heptose 7-phosphate kinase/heptose 1-phosphate adenyltransferase [Phycisphaerales bacterium]|nr:bifunctional heptose 7-phosphate kinase/heptose 1-phosphate adenyltransferase [Phycisphaerales bacterium]
MERLLHHLAEWKPFRAIVVGDFMVDEMVYGDAERLSADAPVPVLHVRKVERNPGGAANLVRALAALNGSVAAVGVLGADEAGAFLRASLAADGVDDAGLLEDASGRPTTVKRNLIGLAQQRHPQKMFRVDYESRDPVPAELGERLIGAVRAALPGADVLCIEDYAKGVCTPDLCARIIAEAKAAGVPVFVDPAKLADYSRYRDCSAITPNRNEAEHATGLATRPEGEAGHNVELARALQASLGCEAVVLTLDRHGALLLERDREPVAAPTIARQVYDVTGAGDVFLAGLAAGRANGLSWPDATQLANVAAGLEVEVFGAQPIPIERVHQQVLAEASGRSGKLRSLSQLLVEAKAWRRDGKRIVFTKGCFDVLHSGHVSLLERAAGAGDVLVVGINTDGTVRALKGDGRPVNSEAERARVLGALGCVDRVILFAEPTPAELIESLAPDVLVKGDEYPIEKIPGARCVIERGGQVLRIPMIEGKSTTATVNRIRSSQSGA